MTITERLAKAREIEPLLTSTGIGLGCDYPLNQYTQELLDDGFAEIREDQVELIVDLLSKCTKSKRINGNCGSYGLKHSVERALAKYTTNGELIAAMLVAGFTHKRHTNGGSRNIGHIPNASFNISNKSVDWITSQNKHAGW